MHQGSYVFAQIIETVVRYQFNQCVSRHGGNRRVRRLTCWEQFLAMSFGQLSLRESLRDIVVCLAAHRDKHYHLGFRSAVTRSTLAAANENRNWLIWRDYAQVLIGEARRLYGHQLPEDLDLDGSVYIIDATTIELCLQLFPWARLVTTRAALKLHLGLSLAGNLPAFFDFSSGKYHDVLFLDQVEIEPGAYYVLDRGYTDFARLHDIHERRAFFVIRAKSDLKFRRLYSRPVDKSAGLRCDQLVVLTHYLSSRKYPGQLRRIKYRDADTSRSYIYLTNALEPEAATIALLYKYRWQIELFFRWVKQHLNIKAFWGRSANAVKTQICIAMCTYLLVAIAKKRLKLERSTYEILQILSVSLFDKTDLVKLISDFDLPLPEAVAEKQATLWDI